MNDVTNAILAIVAGVIGLAMLSVLLSRGAQTPAVLKSAGDALATVITAAVNPVSSGVTSFGS